MSENSHYDVNTRPLWKIFSGLFVGILLLTSGFLGGWYWQESSLIQPIAVTVIEGQIAEAKGIETLQTRTGSEENLENTENEAVDEPCIFIGSKNSDKFHSADSGTADRIKPENRVCFANEEEARSEGYTEGDIE